MEQGKGLGAIISKPPPLCSFFPECTRHGSQGVWLLLRGGVPVISYSFGEASALCQRQLPGLQMNNPGSTLMDNCPRQIGA